MWAVAKSKSLEELLNEPDHETRLINEKRIAYQMKRFAERYARKEKAASVGYSTGDEAFYDTTTIAQLLPFVISSVINDSALESAQTVMDDGQPRGQSAPAEGGNLLNILIDIKKGFQMMELEDQNVLTLRYYSDYTLAQLGEFLACSTSTADRKIQSLLRKLQEKLGGDTCWS